MSKEHYDSLLGAVYGWMVGDVDEATRSAQEELRLAGLVPRPSATAIDLGCGHGVYAVALARLGYSVTALDTCTALLAELRARAQGSQIRAVEADLLSFRDHCPAPVDCIVCMGDTITHLATEGEIRHVAQAASEALRVGGTFIVTFRDYTGTAPSGTARLIPVRSDEARIMTCLLEYAESYVDVTDMVYERVQSRWDFHASSYKKLRLSPARLLTMLEECGFTVDRQAGLRGMVRLVATRV